MERWKPDKEPDESRETRTNRRWNFKRLAPIVLGVASLFGGEHQTMAQSTHYEAQPNHVGLSPGLINSRFGLSEITKTANGMLLGTYSKEESKALRKGLVAKYGEPAVEFGLQLEEEEIQITQDVGAKIALQYNNDQVSKERIAKLDVEGNDLEIRHGIKEMALDSAIEKAVLDELIGTYHFAMRAEHRNGTFQIHGPKTEAVSEWTVQVSYEKYQAPTGEGEVVSTQKMEKMLNDYLSKQQMDPKRIPTHYNFKYVVKDPDSSPDHPVYILVEGIAEEPAK
jgi:hypothetical protein